MDGARGFADQHIVDIFALRNGGDEKIFLLDEGHGDGDIFETVDHQIDLAAEEGHFELADEETFAADFVKGTVGDLIATGFEDLGLDLKSRMMVLQLVDDEL